MRQNPSAVGQLGDGEDELNRKTAYAGFFSNTTVTYLVRPEPNLVSFLQLAGLARLQPDPVILVASQDKQFVGAENIQRN